MVLVPVQILISVDVRYFISLPPTLCSWLLSVTSQKKRLLQGDMSVKKHRQINIGINIWKILMFFFIW